MAGMVRRAGLIVALAALFIGRPAGAAVDRPLWERDGLAGREVRSLALTTEPRVLVALTGGTRDAAPLWRREAEAWVQQSSEMPALALALAPLPEGGVLVGAGRDLADAPGVFWIGGRPTTTRRLYGAQAVGALVATPDPSGAPSTVYAATAPWADRDVPSAILRHQPGVDGWTMVLGGALPCEGLSSYFTQLAASSSDPAGLLALEWCMAPTSQRAQLWRSDDRGDTWSILPGGEAGGLIACVAPDPSDARTVYRAILGSPDGMGSSLQRSRDGGNTWTVIGGDAGAPPNVRALLVDPRDPRKLYAGTERQGAFVSTDGGDSWQAILGLEPRRIWTLALDESSGRLYAGTADGVWRIALP